MSIASQYLRGAKVLAPLPPAYSGILGVSGRCSNPTISESAMVSTTPSATETISESANVTVT